MNRNEKKSLSRRMFLRGAGGFTLALPFLPSLLGSGSRAAADATGTTRFLAVMSINGQYRANWVPDMSGATAIADDVLAKPLTDIDGPVSSVIGPQFDGLRSKLTIPLGLDGLSQPGHNRCFTLTGATHSEGGMNRDSAPFFPYSVDAVLERSSRFYERPPVLGAMRLAPMPRPYSSSRTQRGSSFSWWTEGGVTTRLPVQWDAEVVFNSVFGGGDESEDESGVDPRQRRLLVIDRVKDDFDRLRNHRRLGSADRHRLDNYVDHLRDLQTRIETAASITCDGPEVHVTRDMDVLYRDHIDLMVAAMACGITRVGTLFIKHCRSDGEEAGFHSNSHRSGPEAEATSLVFNTWIAGRVAELLTKLDSVTEADGTTLLDNSLVLWGNELANGDAHHQFGAPVLLAGSAGGRLRTGVAVDYHSEEGVTWTRGGPTLGRPYNQLLTTAMAAMGLTHEDWELGDGPGFGDYQKIGHRYAKNGGWDRYIGTEREMLPHLWMG